MSAIGTVAWFVTGVQDRPISKLSELATIAKPAKHPRKAAETTTDDTTTPEELFAEADAALNALHAATNVTNKHRKLWGDDYALQKDWADLRIIGPYVSLSRDAAISDNVELFGSIPFQGVFGLKCGRKGKDQGKDHSRYEFVALQRLDAMPINYLPTGPGYPFLVNFVAIFDEGPVKIQWICTIDQSGKVYPPKVFQRTHKVLRKKNERKYLQGHTSRIVDPILEMSLRDGHKDALTSAQLVAFALNLQQKIDLNVTVRVGDYRGVVNFSIAMEEAKDIFSGRVKVKTETGRTKPILHWVRSHFRKTGSSVRTHWRGLRVFQWEGMAVEIIVPGVHRPLVTRAQSIIDSGVGWFSKLSPCKEMLVHNPYSGEEVSICAVKSKELHSIYYSNVNEH